MIVIIGMIAAMAVPRMSRGSDGAAEAAIVANLKMLRTAIHMYTAEHGGVLPAARGDGKKDSGTFGAFRRQLTLYSNADGITSETRNPALFPFGPYIARIPSGPLGPAEGDNRINVKDDGDPLSGGASPTRAWKYDAETGQVIFNYNGISSDGVTTYDQY